MNAMSVKTPPVTHPAIRGCMELLGFQSAPPGVFVYDRVMIRYEGNHLAVVPTDDSRTSRAEGQQTEAKREEA
jgi:hypothetical protein